MPKPMTVTASVASRRFRPAPHGPAKTDTATPIRATSRSSLDEVAGPSKSPMSAERRERAAPDQPPDEP